MRQVFAAVFATVVLAVPAPAQGSSAQSADLTYVGEGELRVIKVGASDRVTITPRIIKPVGSGVTVKSLVLGVGGTSGYASSTIQESDIPALIAGIEALGAMDTMATTAPRNSMAFQGPSDVFAQRLRSVNDNYWSTYLRVGTKIVTESAFLRGKEHQALVDELKSALAQLKGFR